MPRTFQETALYTTLYASQRGYAIALLLQTRKSPATAYKYLVSDLVISDEFLPDPMVTAVFEGWYKNYNDPAMRRLGARPIDTVYCNTLQYRPEIRRLFSEARKNGYQGTEKPLYGEWPYYRIEHWQQVDGLSGDVLQCALRNLTAAINNKQLLIEPDMAQRLREELAGEYDWDAGLKTMPVTLATFVQAFSQLPLKVQRSAAQVYLQKGFA